MLAVEPMTDRLLRFLPEWVRDIVQVSRPVCAVTCARSPLPASLTGCLKAHGACSSKPDPRHILCNAPPRRCPLPPPTLGVLQDRRRQLLYVERRMQRKLMNEFRGQVRDLEPVLRARGRM